MKLEIQTLIPDVRVDVVFNQFDRELFVRLSPPFPPSRLIRFDGCKKGDMVEVELRLPLFPQRWLSEITDESHIPGQLHQFTDVGVKLPFFLSSWKHEHILQQVGKDVQIIDRIQFEGRLPFASVLIYPQIRSVMRYRIPIYKSIKG